MEGVQADAERRMVGRGDDPPRVVVLAHVAAPGERLVRDAQATRGGALGQRVQLLGREVVIGDGLGMPVDRRAPCRRRGPP